MKEDLYIILIELILLLLSAIDHRSFLLENNSSLPLGDKSFWSDQTTHLV